MDRNWMYGKRDFYFLQRLDEFISHAVAHQKSYGDDEKLICPCSVCRNRIKVSSAIEMRNHLIMKGFKPDYKVWIWHGEKENDMQGPSSSAENQGKKFDNVDEFEIHGLDFNNTPINVDNDNDDKNVEAENIDRMMDDLEKDFIECPEIFQRLVDDFKKPLYPGCSKFTRLSAVLKLYTLKAGNGWSDKSFTALVELLSEMLPEGNELPPNTYRCKKVLCPLATSYQKIHACPNDCILFWKDYSDLDACPRCKAARYKTKINDGDKKKGSPIKTLWYLPIIPRFMRFFANPKDAEYMVWHHEERNKDGKLRHVADAPQWRTIDRTFPDFGEEPRNLRLGLCTDGINPFGTLSTQHSTWPVMLIIYNLPPWLTTKSKYILLTLLISGPKQSGNDIDVYLAPLIEDLKLLWNVGVKTDKGCPICCDDTESEWLENCGKFVYRGGRRFLPENHQYRKKKKAFYGKTEYRPPPFFLSGKEYHKRVMNINTEFGKPYRPPPDGVYHTMRSIFWDLPYWEHLSVRHCIDVMHVEKNVFDSIIGTLLNMPNKTKDGVKAKYDMVARGRFEVEPVVKGKRTYLPPTYTTLSRKEKMALCESLKGIKVPHGYSSNISRLVSIKDLKLVGLKSHDCHILLTQLLPVAIRSILPKHVRQVIIKLCRFFSEINAKDIDPESLDDLQADIIVTLCELEMYFPISFFDIMVHLIIHLVREIKLCGPVFLRNMWAMEREMGTYKRRVKNRYRPETSIVEATIACETLGFCQDYLTSVQSIGLPTSRHEGRLEGKGTLGKKIITVNRVCFDKAHMYVLQHMTEVHPYLSDHLALLKRQYPHKREGWLVSEHNRTFVHWFKEKVMTELSNTTHELSDNLRWLAYGPKLTIISYEGYDINGFCFYTTRQDEKSTMQNSDVTVVASSVEYVGKGKQPVDITKPYYGVIEDIWELDYHDFSVPLFRCKWADCDKGVTIDDMGFTLVDFNFLGHKDDLYILASQAKQIFYIEDPLDKKRSVVRNGKRRILGVDGVVDEEEYDQVDELSPFLTTCPNVQVVRDEVYVREDHDEGLWFDNSK
ncbi:uncharacterized protein LOC141608187 [Silene latifolia]|uniref:uncharacterized protein LOC141608187 n=1 Tax=Silene latifolia TaxID=37657 RepID=UPI003D779DDA